MSYLRQAGFSFILAQDVCFWFYKADWIFLTGLEAAHRGKKLPAYVRYKKMYLRKRFKNKKTPNIWVEAALVELLWLKKRTKMGELI